MILCLVQARLESKRLPNKVLLPLKKETVIWHLLNRIKYSKKISKLVVIIPKNQTNEKLANYLIKKSFNVYRGREKNVLDRSYKASKKYKAKVIVRITADDPLKDPKIIDMAINKFIKAKVDYLSNCSYDGSIRATYPEGIDVEVFSYKCLEKIWKNAKKQSEKEHVTPYIFTNKSKFLIKGFYSRINYSKYRWTLDYYKDYIFIKKIYEKLYKNESIFYMKDIINFLEKFPKIININNKYVRYEGYKKSLLEDL